MGGAFAKYAAEGVGTYLVTATRGERGRLGPTGERPGPEVVAPIREAELRAAASELGIKEVSFLDYIDADLDKADPVEAQTKIVRELRRIRPQVVATFAPDGAYGHPDHIAICQFTTAAVIAAADASFAPDAGEPHRIQKLYYMAWGEAKWAAYQAALKKLVSKVDDVERQAVPWPDWEITTVLDTSKYADQIWRAVSCHKSQISIFEKLHQLPADGHQALWGVFEFYRVMSQVNGGRARETDLFEGLR